MTVIRRVVTAPGIELDIIEAGPADGPVGVLLHGFPGSAHSWRHHLGRLADAGAEQGVIVGHRVCRR